MEVYGYIKKCLSIYTYSLFVILISRKSKKLVSHSMYMHCNWRAIIKGAAVSSSAQFSHCLAGLQELSVEPE